MGGTCTEKINIWKIRCTIMEKKKFAITKCLKKCVCHIRTLNDFDQMFLQQIHLTYMYYKATLTSISTHPLCCSAELSRLFICSIPKWYRWQAEMITLPAAINQMVMIKGESYLGIIQALLNFFKHLLYWRFYRYLCITRICRIHQQFVNRKWTCCYILFIDTFSLIQKAIVELHPEI